MLSEAWGAVIAIGRGAAPAPHHLEWPSLAGVCASTPPPALNFASASPARGAATPQRRWRSWRSGVGAGGLPRPHGWPGWSDGAPGRRIANGHYASVEGGRTTGRRSDDDRVRRQRRGSPVGARDGHRGRVTVVKTPGRRCSPTGASVEVDIEQMGATVERPPAGGGGRVTVSAPGHPREGVENRHLAHPRPTSDPRRCRRARCRDHTGFTNAAVTARP